MKQLKEAERMLSKIISSNFKALLVKAVNDADFVIQWLFDNYKIKPVIVGGMAVQFFGYRRFTEDIDILLSKEDYARLEEDGKIRFGQLKIKPGVQIDVLCTGKDNNPHPETVRGEGYYPTFEGLIYLKLLSNRTKDQADIVELLKVQNMDDALYIKTMRFLPKDLRSAFKAKWDIAVQELKK